MSSRSPYIVSPPYDWTLFLLPPVVALVLGVVISGSEFSNHEFTLLGVETTWAELALGTLVHAHLVAVLFRSHGNRDIFRLYPKRFIVVPLVLWVAIASSAWIAITSTVVATFWDVWHSGAQTFGFARIYDRNAGIPPALCRRLDLWMNQVLYIGPILGGVTLIDHLESLDGYQDLGTTFFSAVPATVNGYQRYLTYTLLALGTIIVAWYVIAHWRLWRRGYRFSPLKLFLVPMTGLCSIYSWGFNSWGEAFFIMNFFHAVQYLGLVWAMENRRIAERLGVERHRRAKLLTIAAFLGPVFVYGAVAQVIEPERETLWALTMVVSLMHFWYDGFIWSVAKKQV